MDEQLVAIIIVTIIVTTATGGDCFHVEVNHLARATSDDWKTDRRYRENCRTLLVSEANPPPTNVAKATPTSMICFMLNFISFNVF